MPRGTEMLDLNRITSHLLFQRFQHVPYTSLPQLLDLLHRFFIDIGRDTRVLREECKMYWGRGIFVRMYVE